MRLRSSPTSSSPMSLEEAPCCASTSAVSTIPVREMALSFWLRYHRRRVGEESSVSVVHAAYSWEAGGVIPARSRADCTSGLSVQLLSSWEGLDVRCCLESVRGSYVGRS